MAIAFEEVQSGVSSASITVATASITGVTDHLYIACVGSYLNASIGVSSVTGLGLTWTELEAQCGGRDLTSISMWWAQGTASSGAVTATFSTTPDEAVIGCARYSGTDTSSPIGNTTSGNTNGTNGACSGGVDSASYSESLTTTQANSFVVGSANVRNRTHTPGTNYTERMEVASGTGGVVCTVIIQDKLVASVGATNVDGTLSTSTDWSMAGIEIKEPSGAGPIFPPNSLALTGAGR